MSANRNGGYFPNRPNMVNQPLNRMYRPAPGFPRNNLPPGVFQMNEANMQYPQYQQPNRMPMYPQLQNRPAYFNRPNSIVNQQRQQHQQQYQQHQQQQQQQQQQQTQRYIPNGQPNRASNGLKGPQQRITIDYYGATLRGLEMRDSGIPASVKGLPADPSYTVDVPLPIFLNEEPDTSFATRFVYKAENKVKAPVNIAKWTPEGRRLITGNSHGEFTPWTGLNFKFDTIAAAHDTSIHAMEWSHDGQWFITSDHEGIIKYWQPNLNNLKAFQGHKYPVRDLSFSPSDLKFVSASDDQQLKIWDFRNCKEERQLTGHTWDVRTVDWHPNLGMIASGSKDQMIRVWDPRTPKCLATIRQHNNSVTQLEWNKNGRWLLSSGRDCCIKLFDVRKLGEEMTTFVTQREVYSIAWHPVHETMFASGGTKKMQNEGSIEFWTTDDTKPKACVDGAHESQIWTLDWHPMGHILASGSNDKSTKLWCRPRPGEHLPTALGGADIDGRIFSDPINLKAASRMASCRKADRESSNADDDMKQPSSPKESIASPSTSGAQTPPSLPGLSKPQQFSGRSAPPQPPLRRQKGPARNASRASKPSRFNPMRHDQRPPRPPPPPPPPPPQRFGLH